MIIAYFDCFSGISGDMVLGALVDAGLQLLHQGRVGLVLLNGGMATRFGGGVKGTVEVMTYQEANERVAVSMLLAAHHGYVPQDEGDPNILEMEKEGFGTREVRERGNFNDDIYGGLYDDYRWEYEVEMVEMEVLVVQSF